MTKHVLARSLPAAASNPTVTVVIPCYRYGQYLPGVVGSVLGQPGVEVDIIIVDDASPDDSLAVAQSLAAAHSNVAVVTHPVNKGHIATYNDGLCRATGTYVVLLSADDLLSPGSLERSTTLLESVPELAFVYGFAPEFTSAPPTSTANGPLWWSIWSGEEWIRRVCRRGTNVVTNPEVVMRRDVMTQLGGYDSTLPHAADLLMWLRAAAVGDVGRVNGRDQAFYRVHGQNMHIAQYGGPLIDIQQRIQTFYEFFSTSYDGRPTSSRYRSLARRGLSVDALRWAIFTQDAEGGQSGEPYAQVAVQTWPGVAKSRLWSQYQRRLRSPTRLTSADRLVFQADWRIRHKLRWRRWRRFGT